MILLDLLLVFMKIGVLSFGGGYTILSMIQSDIVYQYGWLTENEFTNLVTISQMTPGPIAINAATFIGTKQAGIIGSIVATLGLVLPSIIIMTIIALLYAKYRSLSFSEGLFSGMKPAAAGLIASVSVSLILNALFSSGALTSINLVALVIFILSFVCIRFLKINSIYVILGSGVIGAIVYSFLA